MEAVRGGHIFPAVAIANEIKSRFPNAEFLFVGANGKWNGESSSGWLQDRRAEYRWV